VAKQESQSSEGKDGYLYGAVQPRFGEVKIRQRGRLPHWEREAGLYFVTFRLADSLPRQVLKKIIERQRVLEASQQAGLKLLPHQKVLIAEYSPKKIEEYLDKGKGACYLGNARVAKQVGDALHFWDGQRFRLIAWCVMPNHVHVIFRLLPGRDLATLLRGWKLYTSRTANRILDRGGIFWQREYYDRLIRNGNELRRAIQYVISNPEKAGLKDWPWVYSVADPFPQIEDRPEKKYRRSLTGCRGGLRPPPGVCCSLR
jgi:REP element-mobilizing transposase RayT